MVAVAIMLMSLFTASAMAAVQDRDRDEGCTGVPDFAPREQNRAGVGADTTDTVKVAGYGNGNGACDGSNCQDDCDGDMDQIRDRDGSCME